MSARGGKKENGDDSWPWVIKYTRDIQEVRDLPAGKRRHVIVRVKKKDVNSNHFKAFIKDAKAGGIRITIETEDR